MNSVSQFLAASCLNFPPPSTSMVSSLMMGLALGTGGIMSPIVGKLADIYAVKEVLAWMPVVPLVSMLLVVRLPNIGGSNRSRA